MKKYIRAIFVLVSLGIVGAFLRAQGQGVQPVGPPNRVIVNNGMGPCTPGVPCQATITPLIIHADNTAPTSLTVFSNSATLSTQEKATAVALSGNLTGSAITVYSVPVSFRALVSRVRVVNPDLSNPITVDYTESGIYQGGPAEIVAGGNVDFILPPTDFPENSYFTLDGPATAIYSVNSKEIVK